MLDHISAQNVPQGSALPHLIYAHGEEVQVSLMSRKLAWLLPKMYNAVAAQAQQRKSKRR
jgi:hypothetical protein